MDKQVIFTSFYDYKKSFPRNFSDLAIVSFLFNDFANRKKFVDKQQFKEFILLIANKSQINDEIGRMNLVRLDDIYYGYIQKYKKVCGTYSIKGGRPRKNICTQQ